MRSGRAKIALLAGLVAGAVVLVAGSEIAGTVALVATLLLLPAAAFLELFQRGDLMRRMGATRAQVAGLYVCGVLVFADDSALAAAAAVATIVLLLVTGFREGHLRAVWWAAVLLMSAITADALWLLDWDPFDRSEQYEPIGQSPFVLIGLPLPMALIAAGVAARRLWRQLHHP
jgi:hypothetical protein